MFWENEAVYSKQFLSDLYTTLYRIRIFEERCIELYRKGRIRGYFHPYLGEEAIATGACAALRHGDYVVSTHRGHGHCIARGGELKRMLAELFGKATGYCSGRGGSMHIANVKAGNLGANGVVGAGIPLGVGAAISIRLRRESRVSVVFFSDGAANNGVFAEALNLAAVWDLPLILILENNHYAVSTPVEQVTRDPDLYRRGIPYGVESVVVDGNDVLEMYERTRHAAARCRDGSGPVLIEAKTYRHGGHHCNDPGNYMPKDRLEYYKARDPVTRGRSYLLEKGAASEDEVRALEARVERELEAAITFAAESPEPSVAAFLQSTGTD
jgi:pyruvate dehydrogenase E1 component alpha subunit